MSTDMTFLDWLRSSRGEAHAPPDIERDSARVMGRLEALCEHLDRLIEESEDVGWDGEERRDNKKRP